MSHQTFIASVIAGEYAMPIPQPNIAPYVRIRVPNVCIEKCEIAVAVLKGLFVHTKN